MKRTLWLLLCASLWLPVSTEARSYSSGGRSFSVGRSSSSGRGYSAGRSYNSSRSSPSESRRSYSSGSSRNQGSSWVRPKADRASGGSAGGSGFSFDADAARARKEEARKRDFNAWKQSSSRSGTPSGGGVDLSGGTRTSSGGGTSWGGGSYAGGGNTRDYRGTIYVPAPDSYSTRPVRAQQVFAPYYTRPVVVYRDPYSSFFWWWLLDRSLDERAYWAYHHRYDMDPARYQALLTADTNLEARVRQLESQQLAVNPAFVPSGLDRDLMYSDRYVQHAYNNRPTFLGRFLFWSVLAPTFVAIGFLFIWLVFFKRWQVATA